MRAPKRAMVLAAGLGLRMRPLTVTTPKPLLPVAGRCMLDRALDKLEEAGVVTPVVNYHHLGGQVVRHLQGRDVALSDETELLLETGGGVVKALPLLGTEPFFVINADILWEDGPTPALERLALAWDGATMDALLLVHPTAQAYGYEGPGDFFVAEDGRLERRGSHPQAPHVFTGVQILSPHLLDGEKPVPFSLNRAYDKALARGRLFAVVHDGEWYHVGTPDALIRTEELLRR